MASSASQIAGGRYRSPRVYTSGPEVGKAIKNQVSLKLPKKSCTWPKTTPSYARTSLSDNKMNGLSNGSHNAKRQLPPPMLIDGMKGDWAKVNGITMFYQYGGRKTAKPLLLVHGLFQTGMMWRRVAPKLMEDHFLIIPDNRGYGQSEKPAEMEKMTKRLQAQDLYELLRLLKVEQCVVLSHDRGARIARTLAMDHPEILLGASFMDMLPTEYIYQEMTGAELGPHHWDQLFKLASPMAEDLLVGNAANTKTYVDSFYKRSRGFVDLLKQDGVYDYYLECMQSPGAMMAMLNDYRAAAHIDVPRIRAALDRGDRISVPVQVLWATTGNASKSPALEIYRKRCSNAVTGAGIISGHYLAEEAPEVTQDLLLGFVDDCYGTTLGNRFANRDVSDST